jgi:hypothetical protein
MSGRRGRRRRLRWPKSGCEPSRSEYAGCKSIGTFAKAPAAACQSPLRQCVAACVTVCLVMEASRQWKLLEAQRDVACSENPGADRCGPRRYPRSGARKLRPGPPARVPRDGGGVVSPAHRGAGEEEGVVPDVIGFRRDRCFACRVVCFLRSEGSWDEHRGVAIWRLSGRRVAAVLAHLTPTTPATAPASHQKWKTNCSRLQNSKSRQAQRGTTGSACL